MVCVRFCAFTWWLDLPTTMWKLPPASSFDDIPSKGLFCDKEVMCNTSGTAPVFPNVELKSADSMFLALTLYLS